MKKLLTLIACIGGLAILTGCNTSPAVAPYKPPSGALFTQVKAPLTIDYDNTQAQPAKSGQAMAHFLYVPILGYLTFAWGDSSLEEAAANGGISSVEFADYEEFNVLGIYRRSTVFAHGN